MADRTSLTDKLGARTSAAPRYRRKWKRAALERRSAAGAALVDVFVHRRRPRTALPLLLIASLVAHSLLIPMLTGGFGEDLARLQADEDTYLSRVTQKERAKWVSKGLTGRPTMPPPPPDPEAAVSKTLTAEIGSDIAKTIGNMMEVRVTQKLAAKVESDLSKELAEAAKNIADGKLSREQIKRLQKEFSLKAQQRTMVALKEHREETQVQEAKTSVTQWYEEKVSATLKSRIGYELFRGYSKLWYGWFNRESWGYLFNWAGELSRFTGSVGVVEQLARGRYVDQYNGELGGKPLQHGWWQLPNWPDPSKEQAKALVRVLNLTYFGPPRRKPGPAKPAAGGSEEAAKPAPQWMARFHQFVRMFRAESLEELKAGPGTRLEQLWAKALAAAEDYQNKAEAAAAGESLAAAQQVCLDLLKGIHALGSTVFPRDYGPLRAINQATFSRVLRGPAREKMYQFFVDTVVNELAPAIRDLADTEFSEGILIRDKTVDQARKEFAELVMGLLRRDVQLAFPKPQFDDEVFFCGNCPYKRKVTGQLGPPGQEDIERDEAALADALAKHTELSAYADGRARIIAEDFQRAIQRVADKLLDRLTEEGRLRRGFYASVGSVDYTDKVQLRLEARRRAMEGRGQDLARLTQDGLPDTSAPMVALLLGASRGMGASLEPVPITMQPSYAGVPWRPESALRSAPAQYPPPPRWGRVTQPTPSPKFSTYNCEGIPFLANFPKLDGDLSDWGKIRPLVLQGPLYEPKVAEPTLLYAAWNYQGFFFGYYVTWPANKFCYPTRADDSRRELPIGLPPTPREKYGNWAFLWALRGDHLRLMFDTLDSRSPTRGEPHTQEFVIFPRGVENCPVLPGIERYYESKRDAMTLVGDHGWGGPKATCKMFPNQPSPAQGPDGTGPYRVARFDNNGYTLEAFVPRSLFKMPVFAPGWYIGFEARVATGYQDSGDWRGFMFIGQLWANLRGSPDRPYTWGDLLLLGTDPQLALQEADESGSLAQCIIPGRSYLLTVVDPDRNVNLTAEDTVLVSAEVSGGSNPEGGDMEVFVLKETGKNTSIFRGYVNTQPGQGRQVQGVIECMPGQEVHFGYVDFANAKGERNVVYQLKLPVVVPLVAPISISRYRGTHNSFICLWLSAGLLEKYG